MPKLARPPIDRVLEKCVAGPGGCIIYTGTINHAGYAIAGMGSVKDGTKKNVLAHRLVYAELVGPIPDGLCLDHLCRVRRCLRPDHLEPVTIAENVRRGIGGDAARTKRLAITHCPAGHEYSEENTDHKGGARHCRQCGRNRAREYQRKKRAAARGGVG